ncbi:unnamed protein product [Discosporangium mesarthrocarpum]
MILASFSLLVASSWSGCNYVFCIYDWLQIPLIFGLCLTSVALVSVRGWHNCRQRLEVAYGLGVTALSALSVVIIFSVNAEIWGIKIMYTLRILHVALLLKWFPSLSFLARMLSKMMRRAATPASVLFAWAFLMGIIGVQLFGGLVCVPDLEVGDETCEAVGAVVPTNDYMDASYYVLNFNSMASAFVTLFVLMVVNDW